MPKSMSDDIDESILLKFRQFFSNSNILEVKDGL